MAKRVLIPLDQSLAAEAVIPLIADAARGGSATVRLLQVAAIPGNLITERGHIVAYSDQEMARLSAEAMDYLRTAESRLDGVPVESVVRFGHPVDEILREAESFGADLIAVTTTGRSALSRLAGGSVAEQLFRKAKCAVVLLRAGV